MAKHYGNWVSGNSDVVPTALEQYGAWNTNEQFRQKGPLGLWPIVTSPSQVATPLGSIVFALSSGALDEALNTGDYLVPSGQAVSTVTYSELFSDYGYTFGGSGSSFNLPNLSTEFLYLKPTVASGVVPSGQFKGKIPDHSHSYTRRAGAVGGNGFAGGPCFRSTGEGNTSLGNSSPAHSQNRAPSFVVYPLLVVDPINEVPFGCVFAVTAPFADNVLAGSLPTQPESVFPVIIPSGQVVSRTTYSNTFNTLGTLYGVGDGSTTFNLPDLRGSFLEMGNRTTTTQLSGQTNLNADTFITHYHNGLADNSTPTDASPDGNCGGGSVGTGGFTSPATGATSVGDGLENRPSNYSVIFIIKGG